MWLTGSCCSPSGVHWTTGVQDYKWVTSAAFIRLLRRGVLNPPPHSCPRVPPYIPAVKARHSLVFGGSWKRDRSIREVLLSYFKQAGTTQSAKWKAMAETARLRFLTRTVSLSPDWDYGQHTISTPLQGWTSPVMGSRRLRLPEFMDNRHINLVKLTVLRTGRLYLPGDIPSTYFCSKLSWPECHSAAGRTESMKNPNTYIGNRTCDLPSCSAVP
jgi:hypothetical protein